MDERHRTNGKKTELSQSFIKQMRKLYMDKSTAGANLRTLQKVSLDQST
jgi:hypothetical protein